jgi:predicted exporter
MRRIIIAIMLMVLALVTLGAKIEISTETDALFPDAQIKVPSFDDAASREVVITLSHPDTKIRNAFARTLAASLITDPLIEEVMFSASTPSEEFQTWVWDNRFHLAPPEVADFESIHMAMRLEEAVEYFSNINSMIHGDRFLLDPTGSYQRLVQTLEKRRSGILAEQDGVWQSFDQTSAVLHLRLADLPFDVTEVQALSTSIRSLSAKEGVTAHILGLRIIAAETSLFNTGVSTRASILATLLLFCWLVWSLHSIAAALFAFLPVALGLTAAFITVTLIFGAVHIVAVAFGGVLLGLALDYPIHVMGHPGRLRPKAHRLIFLGALTTGISFLAMVGSQVPALVQTGVFILVGLTVSALVTIVVPSPENIKMRDLSIHNVYFRLPSKAAIEYALAGLGIVSILVFSKEAPITLFDPPQHIRSEIQEMAVKLNLPSSKFAIDVRGDTLTALLQHEEQLALELDEEIEKGNLSSYKMLAQLLPSKKPSLVNPSAFHTNARAALVQVGMSIAYSKQQLEAFKKAMQVPAINQKDLTRFRETAELAKRIKISADEWHEQIQITLPIGTAQPDFTINSPGSEMVNLLAPLQASMTDLKTQISFWLLIGLICGLGVLALGLRSWSQTLRIFRTSCAVLGASACMLIILYGSLSLFHIVAMALVLGIGVDYSIILAGLKSEDVSADTSATSVFVCAISTLIAFVVLAFSEVQILHQIGTTVVIGLMLMLLLTLAQSGSVEE